MTHKPALIGIVNVTPDSFSDGGKYPTVDHVLAHIYSLIGDGASVIDIGAESTRPGAQKMTQAEEWGRLSEVLPSAIKICHSKKVVLSLDTYHAQTAAKALHLGVDWINDVTGFADPAMIDVIQHSKCKLVMMHSLTIPADPAVVLQDTSPASLQLRHWAVAQLERLDALGVSRHRVILDPGLGFGKSALQSLEILMNTKNLMDLGCELLIGHSRKSFLTLFTKSPVAQRDELTLSFSVLLAQQGVQYLRVHNVRSHHDLWVKL